jgi:hypothetical protein
MEAIIFAKSIFRLVSILNKLIEFIDLFLDIRNIVLARQKSLNLTSLSKLINEVNNTLHTGLQEIVNDLEMVSKHFANELELLVRGTVKNGTGVTFNIPKIKVIIKHEINTEEFIYLTELSEGLGDHSNQVKISLHELRSEIVINPVRIVDITVFSEVSLESSEVPHLEVSKLSFVEALVVTFLSGDIEDLVRKGGVGKQDTLVTAVHIVRMEGDSQETVVIVGDKGIG